MTKSIIRLTIICTTLTCAAIPAYCQSVSGGVNAADSAFVAHRRHFLRRELDSLDRVMSALREKNDKIQPVLQRSYLSIDEYRKLKEREARLRDSIQIQTAECEFVRERIDSVRMAIKTLNGRIGEVEKSVNKSGREYAARNENLVNASFSEMDKEAIDRVVVGCDLYGKDEDVAKFKHRAMLVLEGKRRYDKSWHALKEPYDERQINSLIEEWRNDYPGYSKSQKKEVDEVLSCLEVFGTGVMVFKQFVDKLNERLESVDWHPNHPLYDHDYKTIKGGMAEDIETSIMKIPFLKVRFEQYREQRCYSKETEAEKGLSRETGNE